MNTLPTESEILAADFSGDTLASLLKTARSYDVGGDHTIEKGVQALATNGFTVELVAIESPTDMGCCPMGADGWRAAGMSQTNYGDKGGHGGAIVAKFRVIEVVATKGDMRVSARVTQKVSGCGDAPSVSVAKRVL